MEGGLSQGKKVGGEEEAGGIGGSRLKSMWEPSVGARHYAQALPQSTALPHTQSPHAYAAPRVVPLPTGRSASLPSRAACQRQRRRGGRRRGVTRPRPAERGGPPPRWSPATPRRAAGAAARSPQTGHEAAAAAVAARLLPPPTPAAPAPPLGINGGGGTGRDDSSLARAGERLPPPPHPAVRVRTAESCWFRRGDASASASSAAPRGGDRRCPPSARTTRFSGAVSQALQMAEKSPHFRCPETYRTSLMR